MRERVYCRRLGAKKGPKAGFAAVGGAREGGGGGGGGPSGGAKGGGAREGGEGGGRSVAVSYSLENI